MSRNINSVRSSIHSNRSYNTRRQPQQNVYILPAEAVEEEVKVNDEVINDNIDRLSNHDDNVNMNEIDHDNNNINIENRVNRNRNQANNEENSQSARGYGLNANSTVYYDSTYLDPRISVPPQFMYPPGHPQHPQTPIFHPPSHQMPYTAPPMGYHGPLHSNFINYV